VTKDTLPTYAIVELLMRLAQFDPFIGDYKDHAAYTGGVIVKTTNGNITFSKMLISKQFEHPDRITEDELKQVAVLFKPAR
jgi:hypothetical protein